MILNKQKNFNLDSIPDMSNSIEKIAESKYNELLYNYKVIVIDSKKILEKSIEENISKPLIMYNLLFMTEIYLKYYLLGFINIREVEKLRQNIEVIIRKAKCCSDSCEFDELYSLLKKIKNKNNQKLDYNKCHSFKYNHEIGSDNLFFSYVCTEKEICIIKEVIKWLNLNIVIV